MTNLVNKVSITLSHEIVDQPIDRLRCYENQPRTHPRAQYAKLARSNKQFRFVNPLSVDLNAVLIDRRLRANELADLRYKTAPTVTIRTNNAADVKAIRLAHNRIPLDAGGDKQMLRDELSNKCSDRMQKAAAITGSVNGIKSPSPPPSIPVFDSDLQGHRRD
jgi:hypothetical protein